MSTAASSLRSIVRRRPLITATVLASASWTGYAKGTEYYTEHLATTSGHLPRQYQWQDLQAYWSARPWTTWTRLGTILVELTPVLLTWVEHCYTGGKTPLEVTLQHQELATKLRKALTKLGPAFVKAGQQLSIRPDLVPPAFLKELQKLCDAVEPVSDVIAMEVLRQELGDEKMKDLTNIQLVASASLGQVYRAQLGQEQVAIKVQRPHTRQTFSLDLYLLHRFGHLVDAFTSTFTQQPPFHNALYESFARGSYAELDYENEAANQIRFQQGLAERKVPVVVPNVYLDYTTERVLTSQWMDGIKLADSSQETIQKLIPVGVELFLTQLLDMGWFHADPHPGNLLVTPDQKLCLIDFGLCAEIDVASRNAMTRAIAHLVSRDFDTLVAHDTKELGFLPADFDTTELKPLMTKILTVGLVESGSDMRVRKRKLMEISNELNEVFFRYPFSVPPFFALVTRGLGLLEGIALSGDPDFDIFQASAPYARRRALSVLGMNTFRQRLTRYATKSPS